MSRTFRDLGVASQEHRRHLSQAMKRAWKDPDTRARMMAGVKDRAPRSRAEFRPDPELATNAKACPTCHGAVHYGTDGDGRATLECRCGVSYMPIVRPRGRGKTRVLRTGEMPAALEARRQALNHPWRQRRA